MTAPQWIDLLEKALPMIAAFILAYLRTPPGRKAVAAEEAKLAALPVGAIPHQAIMLAILWADAQFSDADGATRMTKALGYLGINGHAVTEAQVQEDYDLIEKIIGTATPAADPAPALAAQAAQ